MDTLFIPLLILAVIFIVPISTVYIVLRSCIKKREKKKKQYQGITQGTLKKIHARGDHLHVLEVTYIVDGVEYRVKESAKKRSEAIKWGKITVGQRKFFKIGSVVPGDSLTVRYDLSAPGKSLIEGNDGVITG